MLALLTGCGDKHAASVSGVVSLNGKPLTTGDVVFHPAGNGPLACGRIGPDGIFTLGVGKQQGLPSGEYVVTVVAATEPELGPRELLGKLLAPVKYGNVKTSPLRVTVKPGSNSIPLELN